MSGRLRLDAFRVGLSITPENPGTRPVMSRSGYEFTLRDTQVQCKQIRNAYFDTIHDVLHDFYIRS